MIVRQPIARGALAALFVVTAMAAMAAQTKPAPAAPPAKAPAAKAAPVAPAQPSPGAGPVVVVQTDKGNFEFETYPTEAPKTVARMLQLIKGRFYNGLRIHRVEPGYVVQMGDPQTRDMTRKDDWGYGGSGRPIGVAEISKLRKHGRGSIAMAHSGDPAKADSQFYVCLDTARCSKLDGQFVVWGKVITGMEVVDKLKVEDRIVRMTVTE
jgi:peptidyl-prolyl cis-trans isomerase B (cyclophilin B)